MLKQFTTMILTALIVVVINIPVIEDVDAKGFSSSRSFSRSSSSSSRSSFSSYKSKSTKSSSSKSTKSSSVKAKPKTSTKTVKSKFGGKPASYKTVSGAKQTKTAKAALNKHRGKFKKQPPKATTATNSTYKTKYSNNRSYNAARTSNRSTYHTRRNSYYAGYNTPSYVYYGSPSYGLYDTLFLYSMLNMSHGGQFAHSRSNDADYQQWRREADELALENSELRDQLAALDIQTTKLSGQPVDPNYIPAGVDADLMLSQEALASLKPTMKVCVGSQSGAYFRTVAGIMAPGNNSVNMTAVTSQGTGECLAAIASGEVDAAFVQGDGYWNYVEDNKGATLPFERVFTPFKEAVHLVCNENGPTSIGDLSSKNTVYFPAGSGAAVTWKNFSAESNDYAKVKTVLTDPSVNVSSYEEAMLKVTSDKNACAMYVAAPGSTTLMRNIDQGAKASKLVLVDVEDGTLDNTEDPSGTDVYDFKDIDSYKDLQRKGSCYGYCAGSVESLFVNADFIVNNKWKATNKEVYNTLAVELIGMTQEIHKAVKQ